MSYAQRRGRPNRDLLKRSALTLCSGPFHRNEVSYLLEDPIEYTEKSV